jgi:hypothetical protein
LPEAGIAVATGIIRGINITMTIRQAWIMVNIRQIWITATAIKRNLGTVAIFGLG